MLHMVTLGGSGKKHVDRHPKIGQKERGSVGVREGGGEVGKCRFAICSILVSWSITAALYLPGDGDVLPLHSIFVLIYHTHSSLAGDGVLLGAGATILGNVQVGKGSLVGACSLVLEGMSVECTLPIYHFSFSFVYIYIYLYIYMCVCVCIFIVICLASTSLLFCNPSLPLSLPPFLPQTSDPTAWRWECRLR